jgi:hypothetical protein
VSRCGTRRSLFVVCCKYLLHVHVYVSRVKLLVNIHIIFILLSLQVLCFRFMYQFYSRWLGVGSNASFFWPKW